MRLVDRENELLNYFDEGQWDYHSTTADLLYVLRNQVGPVTALGDALIEQAISRLDLGYMVSRLNDDDA